MLAVLLFILSFFSKIRSVFAINFIVPLLIVRPYLFSFDLRMFSISAIIFIALFQILSKKVIKFSGKASYIELALCYGYIIFFYFIIGFRHYNGEWSLNIFTSHLILMKFYIFWILLKKQNILGQICRLLLIFCLLSYDGRTELVIFLFLLYSTNVKNFDIPVRRYFLSIFGIIFLSSISIFTGIRNIANSWNISLENVYSQVDLKKANDIMNEFLINRLNESELGTFRLLELDPNYLATYSNLPDLLVPRFINPDKGYFMPGLYYTKLLGDQKVNLSSKNTEVGFIGIWWHNFGFFSVYYFLLVLIVCFLIKDFNQVFLIYYIPRLFADYNQFPALIELLLLYFLFSLFYYVQNTSYR